MHDDERLGKPQLRCESTRLRRLEVGRQTQACRKIKYTVQIEYVVDVVLFHAKQER